MFCENGGTQIKDGAKFCPNCGGALTAAPPVRVVSSSPSSPTRKIENNNDWTTLLLISIVLYAVSMITNFLINTFSLYGIPYIYAVTTALITASFIVGICTIVKLKSIISALVLKTAIILLSIMALIEFQSVIRNIIGW
jgi:hypothetical protein